MKRFSILCASASLAFASLCASASLAGPPPPPPPLKLPDLVITSFGLSSWGKCVKGQTVFTFTATIKNQGAASWTGSTEIAARDLKAPTQWFTSVAVLPIAPGHSTTVSIPISYQASNPGFMSSASPHPFQAVVNETHHPVESNFANNAGPGPVLYMGKRVINVAPPKGCGK
jgi:hypothetical protein